MSLASIQFALSKNLFAVKKSTKPTVYKPKTPFLMRLVIFSY